MGLLAFRYRLRVLSPRPSPAAYRLPDRRHGRLHDGGRLRLHRWPDRHRQAPRPGPRRCSPPRSSPGRCSAWSAWPRWLSAPAAHLIFESMTANITGVAAVLARVPGLRRVAADRSETDFATVLHYWPLLIVGVVDIQHHVRHPGRLVGVVPGDGAAARRARRAQAGASSTTPARSRRCPLQLRDVRFRYPRPTTTRSVRCR